MKTGLLKQLVAGLGLVAALLPGLATAEDGVVNFSGKDPTEDELIDALMPKKQLLTRGINRPGATTAGGAAIAPAAVGPAKASFDQITFELNSDKITPRAKSMLDKLGRALSSAELSDVEFVIEGHTDASGSLQYNMNLSKRRAESVKHYLVEEFQIEPSRLKTEGKGPTDLLDKSNPKSGSNRRVVFMAQD